MAITYALLLSSPLARQQLRLTVSWPPTPGPTPTPRPPAIALAPTPDNGRRSWRRRCHCRRNKNQRTEWPQPPILHRTSVISTHGTQYQPRLLNSVGHEAVFGLPFTSDLWQFAQQKCPAREYVIPNDNRIVLWTTSNLIPVTLPVLPKCNATTAPECAVVSQHLFFNIEWNSLSKKRRSNDEPFKFTTRDERGCNAVSSAVSRPTIP
eukprot:scaffold13046_cov50-Cyclotella_meneghiniana.AAC.1